MIIDVSVAVTDITCKERGKCIKIFKMWYSCFGRHIAKLRESSRENLTSYLVDNLSHGLIFFCDSPKITHEYPFEAAQKQPSPYTYKRSRKCNRTQPLMHALHPTERARRLENQSTFCSVARTASKNINVTGFLIKKVTAFIFLLNVKNMPFWISLNVALGVSLLLYAHLLV